MSTSKYVIKYLNGKNMIKYTMIDNLIHGKLIKYSTLKDFVEKNNSQLDLQNI